MTAIVTRGNALDLHLPDESVDLIVTSPPYWSLRSYQDGGEHYEGQIGDEPTPVEYLDHLVQATAEWARVLKPGGSIFVNLGDKYASYEGNRGGSTSLSADAPRQHRPAGSGLTGAGFARNKSLLLLPQRYAIRCMDELDLICRQELVWSKPNGMPESVTDRTRRSHEQVWHLTKQPRYFAAVDEIREPHAKGWTPGSNGGHARAHLSRTLGGLAAGAAPHAAGALPGSVWSIATAPLNVPAELEVDHHAAFPPELAARLVLGWSPREVCSACGEGRRPVVDRTLLDVNDGSRGETSRAQADARRSSPGRVRAMSRGASENVIIGYSCACPDGSAAALPSVVLDPFGGTGTTALVASVLGRVGISVDLSLDYCRIARWRTSDPGERARVIGAPKPAPVPKEQEVLW